MKCSIRRATCSSTSSGSIPCSEMLCSEMDNARHGYSEGKTVSKICYADENKQTQAAMSQFLQWELWVRNYLQRARQPEHICMPQSFIPQTQIMTGAHFPQFFFPQRSCLMHNVSIYTWHNVPCFSEQPTTSRYSIATISPTPKPQVSKSNNEADETQSSIQGLCSEINAPPYYLRFFCNKNGKNTRNLGKNALN